MKIKHFYKGIMLMFLINALLLVNILPEVSAKYVKGYECEINTYTNNLVSEFFPYNENECIFTAPYSGYYAIQLWIEDEIFGEIHLKKGEVINILDSDIIYGESMENINLEDLPDPDVFEAQGEGYVVISYVHPKYVLP